VQLVWLATSPLLQSHTEPPHAGADPTGHTFLSAAMQSSFPFVVVAWHVQLIGWGSQSRTVSAEAFVSTSWGDGSSVWQDARPAVAKANIPRTEIADHRCLLCMTNCLLGFGEL
jgi:hypothetical protein